jgi:hypothetical protein
LQIMPTWWSGKGNLLYSRLPLWSIQYPWCIIWYHSIVQWLVYGTSNMWKKCNCSCHLQSKKPWHSLFISDKRAMVELFGCLDEKLTSQSVNSLTIVLYVITSNWCLSDGSFCYSKLTFSFFTFSPKEWQEHCMSKVAPLWFLIVYFNPMKHLK